ncbi:MAG: hypothetical protein JOZ33_06055 [Acidobacteriaceae bacterium]|nr:hypothetical protein [Acidobacteriaceae bacterium]
MPAGVDEGTTLPLLNYEFSVLGNRPVSFTLYSSRTRHDAHGEITALEEADLHRHPPLVTLLRYGRKLREVYLIVRLRVSFTEVGTLELWCESRDTPHRWRLQFQLRGEEPQTERIDATESPPLPSRLPRAPTSDASIESAAQLIRKVFGRDAEGDTQAADTLGGQMEAALGVKRDSWPIPVIRRVCDGLISVASGRTGSPSHEARWLNLYGWCLRPGFGVPGDHARIRKVRPMALNRPVFADDLRCQVEMLVLLRRIAGGISASDQQALYRTYAVRSRKSNRRVNRQLEYEQWRLIASLEHLLGSTRALLGNELLTKIKSEPENAIWLWSLGRLGARIPLYGPLHSVVPAEIAGEWVKALLDLSTFTAVTGSAILLIARRTNDISRDIDAAICEQAISRLMDIGVAEDSIQLLSKYVSPERADVVRTFGESLPPGLQLEPSSNCLMSLPAFHSPGPTSWEVA